MDKVQWYGHTFLPWSGIPTRENKWELFVGDYHSFDEYKILFKAAKLGALLIVTIGGIVRLAQLLLTVINWMSVTAAVCVQILFTAAKLGALVIMIGVIVRLAQFIMGIHADNRADLTNETSSDVSHQMDIHADNEANLTYETSSDVCYEMLDDNPENNKEIIENVNKPMQKKNEIKPLQESGPIYLLQQCGSCNKSKRFLNKSSLSCDTFICSECQQQNRSTNPLDEANDKSFDTINNQQTTGVCDRFKEDYRRHSMQELKKREKDVNTQVVAKHKLCEPCAANEKSIPACFFCAECENELFCEPCGTYHSLQKATRTHRLQNIRQYADAAKAEVTNIQKMKTKATRTHRLQNFRQYADAAKAEGTNIQKMKKISKLKENDERSTPGKPSASAVGSDTITLTWTTPSLFKQGDHFQISCREYKESRWKICHDNVEINNFKLTNVKSESQFIFRIRAVYNDYESDYSKESDIVTTRKSIASQLVGFSTVRSAPGVLPIQYALPMTEVKKARNSIGKTRKFQIGYPRKLNWEEKTILLIGETGTGKSTLVDGMANFILGVNWNDEFRFTIVNLEDEEKQKNQAVSQTEWITCYTMHPQDGGKIPYILNIIDTPGFGDTRGLQRDQEIVEQIRELFTVSPPQGVYIIDSVCFLIKAPDARLTPTQSYIFQSIMSLFGKDIEENICSLITFADGLDPPVKTALEVSGLPFGKWFPFNNSALFAKNTTLNSPSMSPMFWDMGLNSFRNFFKHLETLPSTSLKLTSDVLNERHELEAIVKNLEPLLEAGLVKINTLKSQIKCFEENKSIIADNKAFTYTVKINKQLKKDLPAGEHVTNCTNCHFTCHEKCAISNDAEKRRCWAIDQTSGDCKICPNKCIWNKHFNTPYIFEYIVVDEQQTYSEMKQKYEDASGKALDQEQLIAEIKADLNNVVETVDEMMETFNASKARLNEIALRPNPLTMKEHIDLLIENEKMVKKNGWFERIKTLQMFRKRADIDKNVSQFRMQATSYVTVSTETAKNKKKDKPNIFVRGYKQILKRTGVI